MDLTAEIRAARIEGMLVPFLGSGMSIGVCRSWSEMVRALEERAGLPAPATDHCSGDLQLTGRAAQALKALLHGGEARATSVRGVLALRPDAPTASTQALAEVPWPLVLTTNYDDLYPAAVHAAYLRTVGPGPASAPRVATSRRAQAAISPVVVVGRAPRDCHRVLSALRHPAPPLLWALQGFLGGQATITGTSGRMLPYTDWLAEHGPVGDGSPVLELGEQVVFGHADYRRVAQRHEDFRRAFAEVFRSRSLLFLGSGLRDRYLLDLFSQIVELYGPSPRQHYAVVATDDQIDQEMLRDQFGIRVHEIDSYDRLPETIRVITSPPAATRTRRWSVSTEAVGTAIEILDGGLPRVPRSERERCLVVSGGGSGAHPRIGSGSAELLAEMGVIQRGSTGYEAGRSFRLVDGHPHVWRLSGPADTTPVVLAARARVDPSSRPGNEIRPVSDQPAPGDERLADERKGRLWRDVRLAKPVMQQVLNVAHRAGCTEVHTTIWGAGRLRVTPVSYAIFEMVRGWGTVAAPQRLPLTIYVRDRVALDDLRSGRLSTWRAVDAAGGDLGTGTIEFWFEVVVDGVDVMRVLRTDDPGRRVLDLLAEYAIDGPDWRLDLEPHPCLRWGLWTVEVIRKWEERTPGADMTLERFGVLHGATVRAERDRAS